MEDLDLVLVIGELVGGLALFIYGMKLMTGALQSAAGTRMRTILGRITGRRVAGLTAGAGCRNRFLQNLRHGQAKLAHGEPGDKKPEESYGDYECAADRLRRARRGRLCLVTAPVAVDAVEVVGCRQAELALGEPFGRVEPPQEAEAIE